MFVKSPILENYCVVVGNEPRLCAWHLQTYTLVHFKHSVHIFFLVNNGVL
jgi:hypothetical protein